MLAHKEIHKGHAIGLRTGTRQVNRRWWWYTVRLMGKEKRFQFPAWNEAGRQTALQRAKTAIEALPTEDYQCWQCKATEAGYGYALPPGWGLELDKNGNAQNVCSDCMAIAGQEHCQIPVE